MSIGDLVYRRGSLNAGRVGAGGFVVGTFGNGKHVRVLWTENGCESTHHITGLVLV